MKCQGCDKEGKMVCPKCLELNQKDKGWFCNQDCFKNSWNNHKLSHGQAGKIALLIFPAYNPWPWYQYTGKLRPFPYGEKRTVPSHIKKPDYAITGIPKSEMDVKKNNKIEVHSGETIEGMRTVCKLAREVMNIAAKMAKVGTTTDEIDRVVHEACIERDSYPSPLNYQEFPRSVCT